MAFIQNRVEMFQKGGFFVLGYLMIRFIAFIECFLKVLSFEDSGILSGMPSCPFTLPSPGV